MQIRDEAITIVRGATPQASAVGWRKSEKKVYTGWLSQSDRPRVVFQRDVRFGYLFRSVAELLGHYFGETGLELLSILQAVRESLIESVEVPFESLLFLLSFVLLRAKASCLVSLLFVAVYRVCTSEIVAARWAVLEFGGVLLARLAVAHKCYPRAEWSRVRAELALDDSYRAVLLFGLGHLEHQSLPLRQVSRDFVEFLLVFGILLKDNLLRPCAPSVAPRFYHLSPHDPRRLFGLKGSHRPLRDTKSRKWSMVYSLRCRGHEPLRSVSRRLGYIINRFSGPHGRGSTSPFCGLRFPRDPACARPAPLLRAAWFVVVAAALVISQRDNRNCRFHTFDDFASRGKSMAPPRT
jgi:hypothetical protein